MPTPDSSPSGGGFSSLLPLGEGSGEGGMVGIAQDPSPALSRWAKHDPHVSSPLAGEDLGRGERRASLHRHPHPPPRGGGERGPPERSSMLLPSASAEMWVKISPVGEGARHQSHYCV